MHRYVLAVLFALMIFSVNADELNRQQQINCLASNIFYEARGESKKGQIGVGLATINRVKHPRYPNTICAVVSQRGQFSWYMPSKIKSTGNSLFQEIRALATTLYDEYYVANTYVDIVQGATHFHTTRVNPRWRGKNITTKIGNHVFIRIGR